MTALKGADDAPAATTPSVPPRLESIDCLRGVAMVLMALDHTRGFLSDARFSPADLAETTPALFLSYCERWASSETARPR